MIRLNINDFKKIAKLKGGKLHTKHYINNTIKMKWECNYGHTWLATGASIRQGSWCPYCVRINSKYSIEDCIELAKIRNGRCITSIYVDNKTKMEWECEKGHRWKQNFSVIKNIGCWCPRCSKKAKYTIDDCKKFAKSIGIRCIENIYINNKIKMEWECSNHHRWMCSFDNLQCGSRCPLCILPSKNQYKLFNIIKVLFPDKNVLYNFNGFEWLKSKSGKKQEIDIFVEGIKLAIEYDGEQHFRPMRFGNKKSMLKKLKLIQKRDKLKNKKIKSNPRDVKYFVRFNYKENINYENVINKLLKNKISVKY